MYLNLFLTNSYLKIDITFVLNSVKQKLSDLATFVEYLVCQAIV